MASNYRSLVKDLRECAICLEDMFNKKPKLLECKHSYCASCISGFAVPHRGSGLKVACPKCKYNTVVHSGELSQLPDNFLLQEVKEVLDDHMRYHHCFYCYKLDKEVRAVNQCTYCHRYMCKDCTEKHRKNQRFAKHEIITLEEEEQECCPKHQESVVFVCRGCSPLRLLCDVCLTLETPCHDDSDLVAYTEALAQEESNLRTRLTDLSKVHVSVSECEAKLKSELIRIHETGSTLKEAIDKATNELILKTEKSFSLSSLKLSEDAVNKLQSTAVDLLKSDKKNLMKISQAEAQVKVALETFSREEKKAKAVSVKLNLDSELKQELLKTELKRFIFHDHSMVGRPNLVSNLPIEGAVKELQASTDGQVVYVCQGGRANTEQIHARRKHIDLYGGEPEKMELKYEYKEDQWSPLNPKGKKQYDRSFLLTLQYVNDSITKPEGLPFLPDVILDKPLVPGRSSHREPYMRPGSVPDFTPGFIKPVNAKVCYPGFSNPYMRRK